MDLLIREVTADDAERLVDYASRLFAEDLQGIFRRPIPTLQEELEFISAHVSGPRSTLLMAEAGADVVGLIGLVGEALPEEAHVGTFGISVDRRYRECGVGGALLESLVVWAGNHGISRVQGFVWATNPRALEFYERHDFEREGVLRRAIIRDGEPIDVYAVARLLEV